MTASFRATATHLRVAAGVVREVRTRDLPLVQEHHYLERDDLLQRLDKLAASLDEIAAEADLLAERFEEGR